MEEEEGERSKLDQLLSDLMEKREAEERRRRDQSPVTLPLPGSAPNPLEYLQRLQLLQQQAALQWQLLRMLPTGSPAAAAAAALGLQGGAPAALLRPPQPPVSQHQQPTRRKLFLQLLPFPQPEITSSNK